MSASLVSVHPEAIIGKDVHIDPFTMIHRNAVVGEGTWIGSNVTIMEGARIGSHCRQLHHWLHFVERAGARSQQQSKYQNR